MVGTIGKAEATVYQYNFNGGQFGNNTGPDTKGTFAGSFLWDTTANGGSGAWTEWQLNMYPASGSPLLYSFKNTETGAGCFSSPLQSGTNASGSYASSGPAGSACGNPTELAVFQNVPYSYNAGGPKDGDWSFFRLLFTGNPADGTLQFSGTVPGKDYLGWSVMKSEPTSPTCSGSNAQPPAIGSCPYSGNNQNNQNIRGFTSTPQITAVDVTSIPDPNPEPPAPSPVDLDAVPGPLPLMGCAAGFAWSRRLRRRLRNGRA